MTEPEKDAAASDPDDTNKTKAESKMTLQEKVFIKLLEEEPN